MKTVDVESATAVIADNTTDELGEEPVIFTRRGKPVAALVALENDDLESVSLGSNPRFLALIERSRARHMAEGGISSDTIRQRLGLKSSP